MFEDLFSIDGKTAVVTGGSRGIGLIIAGGLLRAGAHVIISSRKSDVCAQAEKELSVHGDVLAVPADVAMRDGVQRLAAATRQRFNSRLDILVNNAGVGWGAPLEEYPEAGWDKVMDTNVKGVFMLTQALLPELRVAASPESPARILNISSADGSRVPQIESYAYSSSKAALNMLTRHLARQLASESICVNAIAPGPFPSKMTAFMLESEEGRSEVESRIPLGRLGRPDDIIGATLFLTSRASAYLTGAVIPVDGGYVGCG